VLPFGICDLDLGAFENWSVVSTLTLLPFGICDLDLGAFEELGHSLPALY
jgi:hypothetical protein